METQFKSGFISIIGRPNVGKSTFVNRVVGEKIAIISDKPQTTRHKIQGSYTNEQSQMIFIDTPGIHKPKHQLGNFMVKLAEGTLSEVDIILFMVNAEGGYGKGDQFIIDRLRKRNRPVFLIISKVDLIDADDVFLLIDQYDDF